METGDYKEFEASSKNRKNKFFYTAVFTIFCLLVFLIGIGIWVLVAGNREIPIEADSRKNVIEEIVIVEEVSPKEETKVVQHPAEMDFTEGSSSLQEVNEAIAQEENEGHRAPITENSDFIRSLVELSHNVASELFSKFSEDGRFPGFFAQSDDDESQEPHSRSRRSLAATVGFSALKYLNYLSFSRFMFDEVYSITEFAEEGRKLSGDPDAFFLDNGFWPAPEKKTKIEEKIDNEETDVVSSETNSIATRPPSAFDNGWTPMVNKVSLKFITNMLRTLLNLMREYLMKDHVMECLWFMFCKDMNHQANYNDPMGYLARINR